VKDLDLEGNGTLVLTWGYTNPLLVKAEKADKFTQNFQWDKR